MLRPWPDQPPHPQPDWTLWRDQNTKSPTDGAALHESPPRFDSYENDVPTHHKSGSKGIRTPDPLHAMQVRYQAAPWTRTFPLERQRNLSRLLQMNRSRRRVASPDSAMQPEPEA